MLVRNPQRGFDTDIPRTGRGRPLPAAARRAATAAGAFIADKVVGKGAAALMVLGGVEGLFADVVSRPALELLAGAGIAVEYTVVVPGIMNRAGTGTCPVEQLCAGAETAAECLPLIEGFMQKMKEQHG